ncbi:MAG: 4-hydroxy-3-methylbut-2-enyl diphosphate reductase [Andreesenia angusta]|nr:4-hydroxy-3-methylbut-2-enyl diphosphate reductase [Andreesenia angusta]
MEIILAKNAGFCFGVENAIDTTIESLENKKNVYSLGPLIHNDQVVEYLETKGLKVIDSPLDLENKNLIIRSHGVPLSVYDVSESRGNNVIDCTCPFVRNLQKKTKSCYEKGNNIIIIGDKNHPEIIGINGWCENKANIVNSIEDVHRLKPMDSACVVVQTTMIEEKFERIVTELKKYIKDLKVFNTICQATKERQNSCEEVSKLVDAMIVIGGKKSSNTKKLAEISRENCKNVFHIEEADEIDIDNIKKFNKIGITAGASTPDWIINEVIGRLEKSN